MSDSFPKFFIIVLIALVVYNTIIYTAWYWTHSFFMDDLIVLEIIPIFLAAVCLRRRGYIFIIGLVAVMALITFYGMAPKWTDFLVNVNATLAILTGCGFAAEYVYRVTEQRRCLMEERNWLIDKLEEAMADVKTLSGLLPICASCKKIRNDAGYWEVLEEYFEDRSAMEFTHGFCPECVKKYMPKSEEEDSASDE